jgi:hypothetical protein
MFEFEEVDENWEDEQALKVVDILMEQARRFDMVLE